MLYDHICMILVSLEDTCEIRRKVGKHSPKIRVMPEGRSYIVAVAAEQCTCVIPCVKNSTLVACFGNGPRATQWSRCMQLTAIAAHCSAPFKAPNSELP